MKKWQYNHRNKKVPTFSNFAALQTATDTPGYFSSDAAFDQLYPISVRELSEIHWTPLEVAKIASRFLAPDENARIIDIGAGVGKFCLAGNHYSPGHFTGVEQQQNLVHIGNKAIKTLGVDRTELIHGNFTELDLSGFTGVYFFNSFHEQIAAEDAQDQSSERGIALYELYSNHLRQQLQAMPIGTSLATYWGEIAEVPACYQLCDMHFNHLLKLWRKVY